METGISLQKERIAKMDRENVIKTIEGCINDDSFCNKCDYEGCVFQHGSCVKDLLADALELIKSSRLIHSEHALYTVYEKNGYGKRRK